MGLSKSCAPGLGPTGQCLGAPRGGCHLHEMHQQQSQMDRQTVGEEAKALQLLLGKPAWREWGGGAEGAGT